MTKDGPKNINDMAKIKEQQLAPLSKEEFLKKLPKQVVRDGKVFGIRDDIGEMMDNGGAKRGQAVSIGKGDSKSGGEAV